MVKGNESQTIHELKRKIKLLEQSLASSGQNGGDKDNISKQAYENLMKTNERLMQEIIRLNAKQGNDNSVYESFLSESGMYN